MAQVVSSLIEFNLSLRCILNLHVFVLRTEMSSFRAINLFDKLLTIKSGPFFLL